MTTHSKYSIIIIYYILLFIILFISFDFIHSYKLSYIKKPLININKFKSSLSEELAGLSEARGLRPQLLENVETDYLGMINFCLRPNDNALSGQSRSKILNKLTNDIFKALIIGYIPLINMVSSDFDNYRLLIETTECYQDEIDYNKNNTLEMCVLKDKEDLSKASIYINWLENLIKHGTTCDVILGGIYDKGYKGLLTALKDSGCRFDTISNNNKTQTRPYPIDKNICLSILDLSTSSKLITKTKQLNSFSNCVSRAILYGSKYEKDFLAQGINDIIPMFANKWVNGDMNSQEVKYLFGLSLLLRVGISRAEEAVTNTNNNVYITLDNGYNITNIRLYDNYLNAFHRVVEVCLSEISTRLSRDIIPQNDDFLLNFVQWEQSLRRNLTENLWKQNPGELVGKWEFVDVKGGGSLNAILIDSDNIINEQQVLSVDFKNDGKVDVNAGSRSTAIGQEWYFKPGPAHLDTCEFYVRIKSDSDLLLKYVGFIDRGQRIESRFSKSPIRMTGRVLTMMKGELVGSCRFVMALKK